MTRKIERVTFNASPPKRTRVAAHARVSSGKDAMLHSLSAQVSYYSQLIQSHGGWEHVGVYADEAKTGTKDTRENFCRLLADCRAGKIDIVLTKSISRFARNTATLLETVRELKSLGIDVFFEEQNIHTLSGDGELMLSILASYAQEESLSASENQKWRIRKNFQDGIPISVSLLGYRYQDKHFFVVPHEAEIVKRIFNDYLSGKGYYLIAKELNAEGILTMKGSPWKSDVVAKLLKNYTYTGNLLLQRTYRENHITKKKLLNREILPKYHVENSHPAIIDPIEWQKVQAEIQRRKSSAKRNNCSSPFAGKVFCGDCGEIYGRKVWHSTDKYRREIWQCNSKFNGKKCTTPHFTEKQLVEYYTSALSKLLVNREQILDDGRLVQAVLSDTTEVDKQLEEIDMELQVVAELVKKSIDNNATHVLNQEEYRQNYVRLTERYESLANKPNDLIEEKTERENKLITLGGFLFEIHELDELHMEFREERLNATVERITAYTEGYLIFIFRNGSEVKVDM